VRGCRAAQLITYAVPTTACRFDGSARSIATGGASWVRRRPAGKQPVELPQRPEMSAGCGLQCPTRAGRPT